MSTASSALINKLWNYCNILRDDGLSYGDYVEQLTFLLFLKMAHERTQPPYNHPSIMPEGYDWTSLVELDGIPLEQHYRRTLETLSKEPGMLRTIFRKAQNKIQDPAKLKRLIADLIAERAASSCRGLPGFAARTKKVRVEARIRAEAGSGSGRPVGCNRISDRRDDSRISCRKETIAGDNGWPFPEIVLEE